MARSLPLLAALFLAVACGGSARETADADGEAIAFTVNRGGWNEIWLMTPDGSGRTRLTELAPPQTDAAGATQAAWSPDGSRIAFAAQIGTRDEDQNLSEIYVMDADGSNRRRLTTNDDFDGDPTWSPDGKQIAFVRIAQLGTASQRGGIFVMAADGGEERQLTRTGGASFDLTPAWSPDGALIAFTRATLSAGSEDPAAALYVVDPDGAGLRRLIADGGEPAWSPDGRLIAFTSSRDRFGRTCFHECSTNGEIYVARADGSDERRLTESEANDSSPTWSPDGRFLVFVSDRSRPREHENELYVMEADGDDVRRITENEVWDLEPVWRPRP